MCEQTWTESAEIAAVDKQIKVRLTTPMSWFVNVFVCHFHHSVLVLSAVYSAVPVSNKKLSYQ